MKKILLTLLVLGAAAPKLFASEEHPADAAARPSDCQHCYICRGVHGVTHGLSWAGSSAATAFLALARGAGKGLQSAASATVHAPVTLYNGTQTGVTSAARLSRKSIARMWTLIWGRAPRFRAYPYAPTDEAVRADTVRAWAGRLATQGEQVQYARSYQCKRTLGLTALATALSFGIASRNAESAKTAITLGTSLATGALSWLYLGKRAGLAELARQRNARTLDAKSVQVTPAEAQAALEQVETPERSGMFYALRTFGPFGLHEMRSMTREVVASAPFYTQHQQQNAD